MNVRKLFGFCAAALLCGSAFAGNAPDGAQAVAPAAAANEVAFQEGQTPPKPDKGYFWCLISKPAVFKCETEQVKIADATFYMKPVPPVYEWVEEQLMVAPARKIPYCEPAQFDRKQIDVVVRPEHTAIEVVPAVFETVEETVEFRPAMEREISIPAQYKTVMRTIEVEPERDVMCGVAAPADVKLNCGESVAGSIGAVQKPARCITLAMQEEVSPATTKKVSLPAITKPITKQVLKSPATTREVTVPAVTEKVWVETCIAEECIKYRDVPAEYKTIRRMVEKEPAKSERVEVAEKFQTLRKNVLVSPMSLVWRQYSIGKCKAVSDICARYGSLPGSGAF